VSASARHDYEVRDVGGNLLLAAAATMRVAQEELVRLRRHYPGRTLRIVDLIDPGRDCEPDCVECFDSGHVRGEPCPNGCRADGSHRGQS
jgi:hypothetical protein